MMSRGVENIDSKYEFVVNSFMNKRERRHNKIVNDMSIKNKERNFVSFHRSNRHTKSYKIDSLDVRGYDLCRA